MTDRPADPELTLLELGPRQFDALQRDAGYRYAVPGAGLIFTFTRLRWQQGELYCELTVQCDLAGARVVNDNVLSLASFCVSSDRARVDRATRIKREAMLNRDPNVPVGRLVEEACQNVMRAERLGRGAISLRDVADEDGGRLQVVDDLTIHLDHISLFFGLPGSGKSLEAARVACELVKAGLVVGYLDSEWGPGPHKQRATAMYGADFPEVRYQRLARPLVQEVDGLRETIVDEGWQYAIVDSVSFAVHGPIESAEIAAGFLQACRQLQIGLLLVGHQPKAADSDKFPLGSLLWTAAARDIWHFRRSNSDDATDRLVTGITHTKSNSRRRQPPFAIEYQFGADRTTVRVIDPAGVDDLAAHLTIRARLRHALKDGPRTVDALAEAFEVKPNSIVQALKRDEAGVRQGKDRMFNRLPDGRVVLFTKRTG